MNPTKASASHNKQKTSNKPIQEKKKKQLEDYIKENKGISAITFWMSESQNKQPVHQESYWNHPE